MTTTSDWQFRAAYFAMKAEVADKEADNLRHEAIRLRDLSRQAREMAERNPVADAYARRDAFFGPVERTDNKYGTYGE